MKNTFIRLISLTLAAVLLLGGSALAWQCPDCNAENSGNFCPYCGSQKPAETPEPPAYCTSCGAQITSDSAKFCYSCGASLQAAQSAATPAPNIPNTAPEITSITAKDGKVTVCFTDATENGPYKVLYMQAMSSSFEMDRSNDLSLLWSTDKDINPSGTELSKLVPGVPYWILVRDAAGDECCTLYTPERAQWFNDCSLNVSTQLRKEIGEDEYVDYEAFSASELSQNAEDAGMKIEMAYENLPQETTYFLQHVITAPNGVQFVSYAADSTFRTGTDNLKTWNFFGLEWDFGILNDNGGIPSGNYRYDVYINGQSAGSSMFRVNASSEETVPPAVTATPKPTNTPTPKPTKTPTPKPTSTPEPAISVTDAYRNDDGSVTVTWTTYDTTGPYTVKIMQKRSSSFFTDKYADNVLGTQTVDDSLSGSSYTFWGCAPGVDYWIIVEDSEGTYGYYYFDSPRAASFLDFETKAKMQLRTSSGDVSSFSAHSINNSAVGYGAYIQLDYSRLARSRSYQGTVTITAPNGAVYTDTVLDVELPTGYYYKYWDHYSFDEFFKHVKSQWGSVPTGTYTWKLYYDNMYICSATFRVN